MSFPPPTPRQARVLWFSLTTLMLVVILVLVAISLNWLLTRLSPVLLPVALALILAYILDPLVEFQVRKKIPRIWAIALVFLVGLLLSAGLIGSVVPDLIRESRKLVNVLEDQDLPAHIQDWFKQSKLFNDLIASHQGFFTPAQSPAESVRNPARPPKQATNSAVSTNNTNGVQISVEIKVPPTTNADGTVTTNDVELTANSKLLNTPFSETIIPALGKAAVTGISWIPRQLSKVTTWVEFLVGFVLVPVYLFYFLLEKHGINKHWTDYLPITESKAKEELVFVLKAINECLIVFFRGQVLVALCVGVLLTIGYLLLGLNYAILIGAIAATLGVIPYLGAIIAFVLAVTIAAVQFGDWGHPLAVVAIASVVKLLEDFLISPKIIGDRSGLHPLTIILAVLIGAKLFGGILGALIAVPLTATLRTLMFRYIWKKRPQKSRATLAKEAGDTAS